MPAGMPVRRVGRRNPRPRRVDPTQVGDRRLSAVQYLMFNVPDAPVALGCDLPVPEGTVALDEGQRSALADDLADDLG